VLLRLPISSWCEVISYNHSVPFLEGLGFENKVFKIIMVVIIVVMMIMIRISDDNNNNNNNNNNNLY